MLFFDCNVPIDEINRSLPDIRDMVQTPNGLELKLSNVISIESEIPFQLREQISYSGSNYQKLSKERFRQDNTEIRRALSGMDYLMVAKNKGTSNAETASLLGDILNGVHCIHDYDSGSFKGSIAYYDANVDEYVLHE